MNLINKYRESTKDSFASVFFYFILFFLKKCLYLPYIHLYTHNLLHYYKAGDQASSVELLVDCKTVGFFSKSVKKLVKRGVRVVRARGARGKKPSLPSLALRGFQPRSRPSV